MPARGGWRDRLEATGRFAPLTETVFSNPVGSDREGLRARIASLSFVAMLPADERQALLDDLSTRLDAEGVGDTVTVPHRTHVLLTAVRPR